MTLPTGKNDFVYHVCTDKTVAKRDHSVLVCLWISGSLGTTNVTITQAMINNGDRGAYS